MNALEIDAAEQLTDTDADTDADTDDDLDLDLEPCESPGPQPGTVVWLKTPGGWELRRVFEVARILSFAQALKQWTARGTFDRCLAELLGLLAAPESPPRPVYPGKRPVNV